MFQIDNRLQMFVPIVCVMNDRYIVTVCRLSKVCVCLLSKSISKLLLGKERLSMWNGATV